LHHEKSNLVRKNGILLLLKIKTFYNTQGRCRIDKIWIKYTILIYNYYPMSWKSALVTSALALWAQNAIAGKPPCPTTWPVRDIAGVVQSDTRQKIENRLRAVEKEKRHQVVLLTVKNLEEYGYGSIEDMANAIGKECGVGFRGENTGVVVLYTQVPSRYRIENAWTERYITDAHSGRILNQSKSDGICKKEDVSCRLDYITGEIDKLIRKEFPDKQSVAPIDSAIKFHDDAKEKEELNRLLGNLAIGGVLIVVVGGVGFWAVKTVWAVNRKNRIQELKREIFELTTRFQVEKQKYPEWFQRKFINGNDTLVSGLRWYDNETLWKILLSERNKKLLDRAIEKLNSEINSWSAKYEEILREVKETEWEFIAERDVVSQKDARLRAEGYVFSSAQMPSVQMADNPADSLDRFERAKRQVLEMSASLDEIPRFHVSTNGYNKRVQTWLWTAEREYGNLSGKYKDIYGNAPDVNLPAIQQRVADFVASFAKSYWAKNIPELRKLVSQGDSILSPITQANASMRQKLDWYASIPWQLAQREKIVASIRVSPSYAKDARAYAEKTGKRWFLNYDLGAVLVALQGVLSTVRTAHSQRQNLATIEPKLSEFDREYSKAQEYMGLGAVLAALIAEEIRRQQEEEARIRREEERRRREEEEAAERRRRDDESNRTSAPSPSPSPDWNSGWGGGFSWWGATSD
jgi:uncharacterized membrane protein YgcG